jgi:deazaflavin-dependent oxidoreductase (nitroreductase family)
LRDRTKETAMAYLKPPAVTRKLFNPLAMRFGLSGSATLAVPGRASGVTRQVPVIPVEHDGARYIVSTRGEADWVRNARSAGSVELRRGGRGEVFAAVEVPVSERSPIIDAYRAKAGRMVDTYWKRLPDPADHPTFRLEPPAPG